MYFKGPASPWNVVDIKVMCVSFDPGCCSHPSGHNIKPTIYLSRYINNRYFMSLIKVISMRKLYL